MTLRDKLRTDFAKVFGNLGHFAEEVVYYANGAGAGRTIRAIVDRGRPEPFGLGDSEELVFDATLTFGRDDADYGVSTLNEDDDEFDVPLVEGAPATRVRLVGIDDGQDPGAWTVRVAK